MTVLRAVRLAASLVALLWLAGASLAETPTRRLSFEALPSAQIALPRLAEAGYAERDRTTATVVAALLPNLLSGFGVERKAVVELERAPGGYLGKVNPAVQLVLRGGDGLALRLAAGLGWVLRQESILLWNHDADAPPGEGWERVAFASVRLELPPASRPGAAARFFARAGALHPGLSGGFSALGRDLVFLNLRDRTGAPYSGIEDGPFADWLAHAVQRHGERAVRPGPGGTVLARFVANDWAKAQDGEDYAAMLGRDVAWLAPLRARHTALIERAAARYGWR